MCTGTSCVHMLNQHLLHSDKQQSVFVYDNYLPYTQTSTARPWPPGGQQAQIMNMNKLVDLQCICQHANKTSQHKARSLRVWTVVILISWSVYSLGIVLLLLRVKPLVLFMSSCWESFVSSYLIPKRLQIFFSTRATISSSSKGLVREDKWQNYFWVIRNTDALETTLCYQHITKGVLLSLDLSVYKFLFLEYEWNAHLKLSSIQLYEKEK